MNKQKPTVSAQKVLAGLLATRRVIERQGWTQDAFISDSQGEPVQPTQVFKFRRK